MFVLVGCNTVSGSNFFPVILPGVVAHFFCGGSAGVFANAEGGLKGCIIGSFVHGILISLLSLIVTPALGGLGLSGTTFSDADFCMAGILLGYLRRILSGKGILSLCVVAYIVPVIYEQMKNRKEK